MAEPSSLLDPFGIWRGLAAKLEQGAKELADRGVNSDEFAEGMHKVMNAALTTKQLNKELTRRYLEALNVPTRADIEALGERLQAIDDRLVALAAAVEGLGGKPAASGLLPSPPRTRKPPAPEAPPPAAPVVAAPARARKRTVARS